MILVQVSRLYDPPLPAEKYYHSADENEPVRARFPPPLLS